MQFQPYLEPSKFAIPGCIEDHVAKFHIYGHNYFTKLNTLKIPIVFLGFSNKRLLFFRCFRTSDLHLKNGYRHSALQNFESKNGCFLGKIFSRSTTKALPTPQLWASAAKSQLKSKLQATLRSCVHCGLCFIFNVSIVFNCSLLR